MIQFQGPVSFSGADRVGISAFYQIQGEIANSVLNLFLRNIQNYFSVPE
jgi:hypothetical protein